MKKSLFILSIVIFFSSCNPTIEEKSKTINHIKDQNLTAEQLEKSEPLKSESSSNLNNPATNFPEATSRETDFKEKNTNWKLTNAVDPDRSLTYEGDNIITGWIIYMPRYIGEPEPHFHSPTNQFPQYSGNNFRLTIYSETEKKEVPIPENVLQRLGEYSEENPAKIRVNKITSYSEMTSTMNLVEIVE